MSRKWLEAMNRLMLLYTSFFFLCILLSLSVQRSLISLKALSMANCKRIFFFTPLSALLFQKNQDVQAAKLYCTLLQQSPAVSHRFCHLCFGCCRSQTKFLLLRHFLCGRCSPLSGIQAVWSARALLVPLWVVDKALSLNPCWALSLDK